MSAVITTLKRLGCVVVDREVTAGAQKWWLSKPTQCGVTAAIQSLDATPNAIYGWHTADGTEIHVQHEDRDGHDGFFVAKPRKSAAGRKYRRGIDC